jgi:hypothetical protein
LGRVRQVVCEVERVTTPSLDDYAAVSMVITSSGSSRGWASAFAIDSAQISSQRVTGYTAARPAITFAFAAGIE